MVGQVGPGAPEQECPNEHIEDGGHQQRHDEEDSEVQQVDGQVEATGHLVATLQALALTDVEVHQEEPEQAIDGRAPPDARDDSLGPSHGAHGLCPHRMADGDVPAATGHPVAPGPVGSHDPPTRV